jgi:hypothetical protein
MIAADAMARWTRRQRVGDRSSHSQGQQDSGVASIALTWQR